MANLPPSIADDFEVPHDPFPDDLFLNLPDPDGYAYDPSLDDDPFSFDLDSLLPDDVFLPIEPDTRQDEVPQHFRPPQTESEGWAWLEARLIGVERDVDDGMQYEIGCMDVYADLNTGDLGASYLPVAMFDDVDAAAAFYHDMQGDIHRDAIPVGDLPQFAENAARRFSPDPPEWRGALPEEYAAYDALRDLENEDIDRDASPESDIDSRVNTAASLSGADIEAETHSLEREDRSAFQALSAVGIDAEGFDPAKDPPPFYDVETGTAYWIGVFQADQDDQANCITSILSLGRNAETGAVEAQLAPCVPGDWDKTYSAAEYLIEVAQRSGIDGCFDAAEGMALATEQRDLWETSLGLPLEPDAAQDIADYTRDSWELEL